MKHSKSTLTLIELVVTILILVGLSSVLIPLFGDTIQSSRTRVSVVSLHSLREVIMGTPDSPGYFQDIGSLPTSLADLYTLPTTLSVNLQTYDPVAKVGWRGPYLQATNAGTYEVDTVYGKVGDLFPQDSFGNPIVIQIPTGSADPATNALNARLVSPGPNGRIDCPQNLTSPTELTESARGDDEVLFLRVADRP